MSSRKPPAQCLECGGDAINHRVEYISLCVEWVLQPMLAPLSAIVQRVASGTVDIPFTGLYGFMERRGWGAFLNEPDEKTVLLGKVLWEEAVQRGITMREFRPFGNVKNLFVAVLPDGRRIDFEGAPHARGRSEGVWWINDKSVLKKKLGRLGIPTPAGGVAFTLAGARRLFETLPRPLIIKPFIGSASRHTTLHIDTVAELERAFRVAKQVAPLIVIEEELRGSVYRPTLVEGQLIATLRRDQPHIIGDGARTISALVEEANTHPGRQGPYFSHMKLGAAALAELAHQGLTPESVPEPGQRVQLNQKINWGLGGTTTDVTDEVHPDNKLLFEKMAAVLDAPLVGIDFIIEDIGRSWKEQEKCGVIECNSMPFFDNHHLPFEGTPRNVAGPIWDSVMST